LGKGSVICTVIRGPAEGRGGLTRLKVKSSKAGGSAVAGPPVLTPVAMPTTRVRAGKNRRMSVACSIVCSSFGEVSQNPVFRATPAKSGVAFSQ
jgi:hypothetical protein